MTCRFESGGEFDVTCEWCGTVFTRRGRRGPKPKYCSAAHRQAAHRARHGDRRHGYDRAVLVDVLVHHYRKDSKSCGCGWAKLGYSHPEHVADVYEQTVGTGIRP